MTVADAADQPQPAAAPPDYTSWHCRRCLLEVGRQVHHRGVKAIQLGRGAGGPIVHHRTTMYCPRCDHRWQWRPEG